MADPIMTKDFVVKINGTVVEPFPIALDTVQSIKVTAEYSGICDLPPCLPIDLSQFGKCGIRVIEYDWEDNVPYMVIEDIETLQRTKLVNCYPTSYTTRESIAEDSGNIKIEYLPMEE